MSLNPENKCSHLYNQEVPKLNNALSEIFQMQGQLQKFLADKGRGVDYETAPFKVRIDDITTQWRNLNLEMAELLERLPYKEWKAYPEEATEGFQSEEQMLETWYEYADCLHFFVNIGLALGINGENLERLYVTKNKENFDRQDGKYK